MTDKTRWFNLNALIETYGSFEKKFNKFLKKIMKTVVFYEHADSSMEKFMEAFPRHQAVEDQFVKDGKVLGIGPFKNPGEGAMAIFIDKESAEDFVKQDPFASEGLYTKVTIKEWSDEML